MGSGVGFSTGSAILNYVNQLDDEQLYLAEHQPDYYQFNFLNFGGKFVKLPSGNNANNGFLKALNAEYATVPAQGLLITSLDNGFKITDTNGIEYYFEDKEVQKVDGSCPSGDLYKYYDPVNV